MKKLPSYGKTLAAGVCFVGLYLFWVASVSAAPFDGWEKWWTARTALSPNLEGQLRHLDWMKNQATQFSASASPLGAKMARNQALNLTPKATGNMWTLVADLERIVPKNQVVATAVKVARRVGPAAVAFTLVGFLWDEVQGWRKESASVPYPTAFYPEGTLTPPTSLNRYCPSGKHCMAYPSAPHCSVTYPSGWSMQFGYYDSSTYAPPITLPGGCTYWVVVSTDTSNVNFDGVPATDADLNTAISNGIGTDPNKALGQAQKNADYGEEQEMTENSTGPTVTGPSTGSGGTSTNSSTSGGITTVTTKSVTINNSYAGDTITSSTTTTTTTCVDGSCNTETETDTGDRDVSDEQEQFDLCAEHPEASGCAPFDVPAEGEMPSEVRDLSWASERTASGSCPAPLLMDTEGFGEFELSYDPVCTVAEWIRPLIIAMAWFSAGIYVFLMVRREIG